MKKRTKQFSIFFLTYVIIAVAFFLIGGEQIQYSLIESNIQPVKGMFPELSAGNVLEQSFYSSSDTLDQISIMTGTYGRENTGTLEFSLLDGESHQSLNQIAVPVYDLVDYGMFTWKFDKELFGVKDKLFIFRVESTCPEGQAPTICYSEPENGVAPARMNNELKDVQFTFQFCGKLYSWFGQSYWMLVAALGGVLLIYVVITIYRESRGKYTLPMYMEGVWKKYGFLIRQLVVRDFKIKYKRSVLGYLWSFLNPLLTMLVQYFVFSNLFKSDIKNFPVYLLSGTILFSFFQEAVGQGLISVLANAPLITKVYMPKYIYPITKVLSSSVNLLISIIPLLIVTIITGEKITLAILLLPFAIFCLLLFCIGLSMLLASAMVFFRDTQYLWGIATLIWMYATPLFYPDTIIPEQYRIILKLNPLYHFIKFVRTVLIDGVSPEPRRYFYCLVSALFICIVGSIVFKKSQDKFVLYI
ncbi:MAG: ABC transporter permease [Lachnospiraceae bacterium]|jgi:ABC-2 type transport system permease protein|nr:ABC transporter permease [Lachnospiraceae bacterium]